MKIRVYLHSGEHLAVAAKPQQMIKDETEITKDWEVMGRIGGTEATGEPTSTL